MFLCFRDDRHNLPDEELVQESNGRLRRKAVFNDGEEEEEEDSDYDEEDEGEKDDELMDEDEESEEANEIILNFDAHKQRNTKGTLVLQK